MTDLFSAIAETRPQRPQKKQTSSHDDNDNDIPRDSHEEIIPTSINADIANCKDDEDEDAPILYRKKTALLFTSIASDNACESNTVEKQSQPKQSSGNDIIKCDSNTVEKQPQPKQAFGTDIIDSSMPPRTKIICTIGPITKDPTSLKKLINAGMTVARLNFSHGNYKYYDELIQNIHQVSAESKKICAVMLDTKGPEIRTIKLKDGKEVSLQKGQEFTFFVDKNVIGDNTKVAVTYKNFAKVLKTGNTILVDDGLLEFTAIEVTETFVKCKVNNNGTLGQNKGVNLPGVIVDFPPLTEKDIADIKYGMEKKIDFIAASFVRNIRDVAAIRELLGETGRRIKIISKIENQEGLNNFNSILDASDGIMVARGDLGSEIPIEQVCIAQKMMIQKCNSQGKIVITATQMLDSMINNPSPTRAEVSDVANAVVDGSDCVMLSGETAKGKYPFRSVKMMADICREAEAQIDFVVLNRQISKHYSFSSITEAVASSAVATAFSISAAAIIVLSASGGSVRMVSKYRPSARIICVTVSELVARQALAEWGVYPILVGSLYGSESLISRVVVALKKIGILKIGDLAVAVSSTQEGVSGATDQIQIVKVQY